MKLVIDGVPVEMTVQEYLEYKRASTLALPAPDSPPPPPPLKHATPKRRRVYARRRHIEDVVGELTPTKKDALRLNIGLISTSHVEVMRIIITLGEPVTVEQIESFADESIMSVASVSPRLSALLAAGWVVATGSIGHRLYASSEIGVLKYNEYLRNHADDGK